MPALNVGSSGTLNIGSSDGSPRRRWVAPLLIGLVIAVILASAGGFVIWKKLASHGGQPQSAVPATAVAFAEIDLDPSASQKLQVLDQLKKIPAAKNNVPGDSKDLKQSLLEDVLRSIPGVNYNADVKPWLGDRAAVAVVPGPNGEPQPLILIQHKDKAKAETSMRKLFDAIALRGGTTNTDDSGNSLGGGTDPKAFSVGDEFVVIGSSQAVVDAAVSSAKTASLASAQDFSSDVKRIGSGQIVTAWADLGAVYKMMGKAGGMSPAMFSAYGQGRYVIGVHAFADGFEMTGRVIGSDIVPVAGRPATSLMALPDTTAAAVYLGNPGQLVTEAFAAMKASLPPEAMKQTTDQAAKLGIKLPGDVANLLGTDALAAMSAPTSDTSPGFGVRLTPTDAKQGLATLHKFGAQDESFGVKLKGVKEDGKDLVWTTEDGFGQSFATGKGTLGDTGHFKKAMAMSGDVQAALFVDSSVLNAGMSERKNNPTGALGLTVTKDGSDSVFTLRIVLD